MQSSRHDNPSLLQSNICQIGHTHEQERTETDTILLDVTRLTNGCMDGDGPAHLNSSEEGLALRVGEESVVL